MADRFWPKVMKSAGCWEWTAGRFEDKSGKTYGAFYAGRKKRMDFAHRVSWELVNGPVPDGLRVLHMCDNKKCVRPDHLFLGTQKDNVCDMINKGRNYIARGVGNGNAKLTEDQVRRIRVAYKNTHTGAELAAKFGVSRSHISYVVSRNWQHI
jgi:hypothetical protein